MNKGNFELERRDGDHMSYQSKYVSSELQNGISNFNRTLTGLVPSGSSVKEVSKGEFVGTLPCSSGAVINSVSPGTWDHQPSSLQDINRPGCNVENYASSSNTMGIGKPGFCPFVTGIEDIIDMGSSSFSSMLKDGPVLPNVAGMFLQNVTQLPADSGLIERAARFSCFSSGNFSDLMNPLVMPKSMGFHSRNAEIMEGAQEVSAGECSKSLGGKCYKNDPRADEGGHAFKSQKPGDTERSPIKSNKNGDLNPQDGTKLGDCVCGNEFAEGYSSGAWQADQSLLDGAFRESSPKDFGLMKRKRNSQNADNDQPSGKATKFSAKNQNKVEQDSTPTSNEAVGKQVNQEPQALESPEGEYIHMRARRGQATNSHSLAERVRREKISERMKFLQDLVPGCNKVTGKAVMLDEIINYVQSLQRQVEFLSMKLATVNPRLDFSGEGLLAKDIHHPHACPSFPVGFSPETPVPYLPGQSMQLGLQGMQTSSDLLQRINTNLMTMSGQFKESTQLPHNWQDELHNVIHTGYRTNRLPSDEEVNGTMPTAHTRAEM